MKIDIYNHVLPQTYLELVKQHSKEPGMVKRMSSIRMLWDMEHRIEMLRTKFPDVKQVLTELRILPLPVRLIAKRTASAAAAASTMPTSRNTRFCGLFG